jgi:hypothetical protein
MTVVSKSAESLHPKWWAKANPGQGKGLTYLTQSMEDDAPELEKEYAKAPAFPCCNTGGARCPSPTR